MRSAVLPSCPLPIAPRDESGPWHQQMGARIKTQRGLKIVGTSAVMAAFFVGYVALLKNPQFPVTVIPVTALDEAIGVRPWSLWPYVSLWLYLPLVPALLWHEQLFAFARHSIALALAGLGFFLFFPTAIAPLDIDWSQHPSLAYLKSIDSSGNACPSLHAAFAVFCACWFFRILRELKAPPALHCLNVAWSAAILYSTLATKQHLVVDLLAGSLLGFLAALLPGPLSRRAAGGPPALAAAGKNPAALQNAPGLSS